MICWRKVRTSCGHRTDSSGNCQYLSLGWVFFCESCWWVFVNWSYISLTHIWMYFIWNRLKSILYVCCRPWKPQCQCVYFWSYVRFCLFCMKNDRQIEIYSGTSKNDENPKGVSTASLSMFLFDRKLCLIFLMYSNDFCSSIGICLCLNLWL